MGARGGLCVPAAGGGEWALAEPPAGFSAEPGRGAGGRAEGPPRARLPEAPKRRVARLGPLVPRGAPRLFFSVLFPCLFHNLVYHF